MGMHVPTATAALSLRALWWCCKAVGEGVQHPALRFQNSSAQENATSTASAATMTWCNTTSTIASCCQQLPQLAVTNLRQHGRKWLEISSCATKPPCAAQRAITRTLGSVQQQVALCATVL